MLVPVMLFMGLIQSSCFGTFALTSKAHSILSDIGPQDKVGGVIRSVIMYVAFAIPVMGVVFFIDIVVLNLIEFWTGSNPLAMEEGDMEQQLISYKGDEYLVIATKNQFEFQKLGDDGVSEVSRLQFCDEDNSWSYVADGESRLLSKFRGFDAENNAILDVYADNGVQSFKIAGEQL
jgi:hypothetical protein